MADKEKTQHVKPTPSVKGSATTDALWAGGTFFIAVAKELAAQLGHPVGDPVGAKALAEFLARYLKVEENRPIVFGAPANVAALPEPAALAAFMVAEVKAAGPTV